MFLDWVGSETRRINNIIEENSSIDEKTFFEKEINRFITSRKRQDMITGEKYYNGEHKILDRKRTAIGEGGQLYEIQNLPNNKIVDNQYSKLVDQKVNYLLAKPITFSAENKVFLKLVKNILGMKFMRLIKCIGEDCLNGGVGWIYLYINEMGEIDFFRFRPYEILPFWKDNEHSELDCVVRVFDTIEYIGGSEKIIHRVEIYKDEGFYKYTFEGGSLHADGDGINYYIKDGSDNGYGWGKIPIIAFKQNCKEIPLIKKVKGIQDALNELRSDFINNMQEDKRNTILIIKNYDGTDLGEFRRNLSEFGAVKVRSVDGVEGGIECLQVEVNATNYITVCDMLKKAIIENGRGFDAKDERFNSNPNQMNILSMYSDIDLDANGMESEFQVAIEEIIDFIKLFIAEKYGRNFNDEIIEVIFNRDQMINESEIIDNCLKSLDILDKESVIAQHPWVRDVEKFMRK